MLQGVRSVTPKIVSLSFGRILKPSALEAFVVYLIGLRQVSNNGHSFWPPISIAPITPEQARLLSDLLEESQKLPTLEFRGRLEEYGVAALPDKSLLGQLSKVEELITAGVAPVPPPYK